MCAAKTMVKWRVFLNFTWSPSCIHFKSLHFVLFLEKKLYNLLIGLALFPAAALFVFYCIYSFIFYSFDHVVYTKCVFYEQMERR